MDKKYKIKYDRSGCIGAGTCASLCPKNWKISDDGKADYENKEFGEEDLKCNMEAADSCPVNVIHIIDKKTGKQLI